MLLLKSKAYLSKNQIWNLIWICFAFIFANKLCLYFRSSKCKECIANCYIKKGRKKLDGGKKGSKTKEQARKGKKGEKKDVEERKDRGMEGRKGER